MEKGMLASGKLPWLWPYGLAVSLAGAATGLSLLLAQLAGRPLFILFYAAAGIATWQGGPRAGLLTIVLSALAITYLLLPPASSFEVGLEGLVQLIAFVLVALLLTWLVEARRRAEAALAEREKQLRSIIDAAPALISYIGADLRYRFNNRAYESWFGPPKTK
jgi:PAS domain-containing protein